MLEVGWPDPALVTGRIESTRSCAASSASVSRPASDVRRVVVMATPLPPSFLLAAAGVVMAGGQPDYDRCVRPGVTRLDPFATYAAYAHKLCWAG